MPTNIYNKMTTQEMHTRVEFYVDKAQSPRFLSDFHYDQSLNIAQDKIIQDKYDNVKQHKMYAFQIFQKIRDDLRPIVKTVDIVPVGNLITLPSDYMYEVGLALMINSVQYDSREVTYNQLNGLNDNSFTSIQIDEPVHIEDQNGINVYFGPSGNFMSAKLSYLSIPPVISLGLIDITAGPSVLIIGQNYLVTVGTVTHNLVSYMVGQQFVAVNTILSGIGTVISMTNCILSPTCHEEICKVASGLLIGTVQGFDQSKFLDSESEKV